MAAYNQQITFENSILGDWIRRHLMTNNPNFAPPSYTGPEFLRQNPSNSGLPAISLGGDRKTPQMAQPESGTPYPQMDDPAQVALRQQILLNDLLRQTRGMPQRPQMAQPESGTPYPQYQPPAPRPQMVQPESGTPYPQYQPTAQPQAQAQAQAQGNASMAAARPQEIAYANSQPQGKYFWLDKGNGSPLTPYYSKDGSKPNIPGTFAFEDPNYKPFFGLFGGS